MRYLLQRPLPDELLSSVWIRSVRRAGLPIGVATRAVTGRKWAPGFFQVSHVADLGPLLGTTPVELLWRHTVFPYATAFFGETVFVKTLATALGTGGTAACMGAVTQGVSDQVPFRRFCVQCAREDRARWGESYWRREHNLPGVLVCTVHHQVLREVALPTSGTGAWAYALPHELRGQRVLRRQPGEFIVELARRAASRLNRAFEAPMSRRPLWYREQLITHGLLSPGRQVSEQALVSWALALLGGKAVRFGFNESDARLQWLGLMVRPRESIPFVPLKHLVFETALALCGHSDTAILDHAPSGLSARPKAQRDKEFAAAVMAVMRGYASRGEKVRVSDALTEANCWATFRHNRNLFPRTAAAVRMLRNSAVSVRQIKEQPQT
jgi:hypothetical protein